MASRIAKPAIGVLGVLSVFSPLQYQLTSPASIFAISCSGRKIQHCFEAWSGYYLLVTADLLRSTSVHA